MPDITDLVPSKTVVPSPQQPPARGVITTGASALTDATITVVVPSHSTTYSLDLRWIRQGAVLPQAGADCKVMFDETGEGIVVWWAGGGTQPAGGDLTGTYPNPTITAPPQARVFNSATISIVTSGTRQTLTFDSERYDTASLHSTASNTSRLTAPTAGLWEIGASVQFASNATGYREVDLIVNGTAFIAVDRRAAISTINVNIVASAQYQLAAGDFVEVAVVQTSGGALNVDASAAFTPEFWMTRLSH